MDESYPRNKLSESRIQSIKASFLASSRAATPRRKLASEIPLEPKTGMRLSFFNLRDLHFPRGWGFTNTAKAPRLIKSSPAEPACFREDLPTERVNAAHSMTLWSHISPPGRVPSSSSRIFLGPGYCTRIVSRPISPRVPAPLFRFCSHWLNFSSNLSSSASLSPKSMLSKELRGCVRPAFSTCVCPANISCPMHRRCLLLDASLFLLICFVVAFLNLSTCPISIEFLDCNKLFCCLSLLPSFMSERAVLPSKWSKNVGRSWSRVLKQPTDHSFGSMWSCSSLQKTISGCSPVAWGIGAQPSRHAASTANPVYAGPANAILNTPSAPGC